MAGVDAKDRLGSDSSVTDLLITHLHPLPSVIPIRFWLASTNERPKSPVGTAATAAGASAGAAGLGAAAGAASTGTVATAATGATGQRAQPSQVLEPPAPVALARVKPLVLVVVSQVPLQALGPVQQPQALRRQAQ